MKLAQTQNGVPFYGPFMTDYECKIMCADETVLMVQYFCISAVWLVCFIGLWSLVFFHSCALVQHQHLLLSALCRGCLFTIPVTTSKGKRGIVVRRREEKSMGRNGHRGNIEHGEGKSKEMEEREHRWGVTRSGINYIARQQIHRNRILRTFETIAKNRDAVAPYSMTMYSFARLKCNLYIWYACLKDRLGFCRTCMLSPQHVLRMFVLAATKRNEWEPGWCWKSKGRKTTGSLHGPSLKEGEGAKRRENVSDCWRFQMPLQMFPRCELCSSEMTLR